MTTVHINGTGTSHGSTLKFYLWTGINSKSNKEIIISVMGESVRGRRKTLGKEEAMPTIANLCFLSRHHIQQQTQVKCSQTTTLLKFAVYYKLWSNSLKTG